MLFPHVITSGPTFDKALFLQNLANTKNTTIYVELGRSTKEVSA
jgi:hypothetical protein